MITKIKKAAAVLLAFALVLSVAFVPTETNAASSYKYITNKPVKVGKYYYKTNSSNNLYRSKKLKGGYKRVLKFQTGSRMRAGYCTNGKYIYTAEYIFSSRKNVIQRYNTAGKKGKTVKKLPSGNGDFADGWSISEAEGNNILLTRRSESAWKVYTYKFNVSSKKLQKVLNNCSIIERSGNYVTASNEYKSDTGARKITLYKISKSAKLSKIRVLDERVVLSSPAFVGKKLFYATESEDHVDLYRCSWDGSGAEKLGSFYESRPYQQIMVQNFTSKDCKVWFSDDGLYRYTYSTKQLELIESF